MDEFDNTVIRMGGFHIVLNFRAASGKLFDNSEMMTFWSNQRYTPVRQLPSF